MYLERKEHSVHKSFADELLVFLNKNLYWGWFNDENSNDTDFDAEL